MTTRRPETDLGTTRHRPRRQERLWLAAAALGAFLLAGGCGVDTGDSAGPNLTAGTPATTVSRGGQVPTTSTGSDVSLPGTSTLTATTPGLEPSPLTWGPEGLGWITWGDQIEDVLPTLEQSFGPVHLDRAEAQRDICGIDRPAQTIARLEDGSVLVFEVGAGFSTFLLDSSSRDFENEHRLTLAQDLLVAYPGSVVRRELFSGDVWQLGPFGGGAPFLEASLTEATPEGVLDGSVYGQAPWHRGRCHD